MLPLSVFFFVFSIAFYGYGFFFHREEFFRNPKYILWSFGLASISVLVLYVGAMLSLVQ